MTDMLVKLYDESGACFIAVKADRLTGFACYDATALGFFGPIGVHADFRGRGTGEALLRACLRDMWFKGYGYAVVGQTTAFSFYEKAVGAVEIKDSTNWGKTFSRGGVGVDFRIPKKSKQYRSQKPLTPMAQRHRGWLKRMKPERGCI